MSLEGSWEREYVEVCLVASSGGVDPSGDLSSGVVGRELCREKLA